MSEPRDRRWFLGTAAGAAAAVALRPRHHRTAASAAAATAGGAVPVTVVNTGTFNGVTQPWAGDASLGYIPVGYQHAPGYTGSLIDGTNVTVQSNQTYVGYTNLGNGQIGAFNAPVSNVTCIGCEFNTVGATSAACVLAGSNITLKYCTFQPTGALAGTVTTANVTQSTGYQYGIVANGTQASPGTYNSFCVPLSIQYCEIWGFANATDISQSTAAAPQSYDAVWVHTPRPNTNGTDHTDGIGAEGPGLSAVSLSITRCNVQANGDTQGLAFQGGPWTNMVVQNNLFGGFGFTVNVSTTGGSETGLTFTGNTYSTAIQPFFGPLYDATDIGNHASNGTVWRGNKWLVPAGAQWGHSQYNGYFWLPASISNASPTLDELAAGLVSLTDYM